MSKGNKSDNNGASSIIKSLWEMGFFKRECDQRAVENHLSQKGINLSRQTVHMGLRRASFLTSRVNVGIRQYVQKFPYTGTTNTTLEKPKSLFAGYDVHSRIKEVVGKKYEDGHYAEAVEAAFKEVIKRVKDYVNARHSGPRLDGDKAMNRAFGFENQEPLIKFNVVQSDEEKDEQRGILNLFKGIVGIRNRKAHENIVLDDPMRALEYLALASLLMRLLDEYAK